MHVGLYMVLLQVILLFAVIFKWVVCSFSRLLRQPYPLRIAGVLTLRILNPLPHREGAQFERHFISSTEIIMNMQKFTSK